MIPVVPLHVLGARGLLAGELLRLAANHPGLHVSGAYARGGSGVLRDVHPHLHFDAPLRPVEELAAALRADLAEGPTALVLALPHGASRSAW